jgi:IS4 transposase
VRAAPEVTRERRRRRKEKARELGKQPCKDMLLRDAWYLLITNIGEDLMGATELFKLYSVRWQIEITFRAWKQSGHLI